MPSSSLPINETAKTGLITKATKREDPNVTIKVMGRFLINFPTTPGQNKRGKKGASVVKVPANTGKNTSPAAYLAAFTIPSS